MQFLHARDRIGIVGEPRVFENGIDGQPLVPIDAHHLSDEILGRFGHARPELVGKCVETFDDLFTARMADLGIH